MSVGHYSEGYEPPPPSIWQRINRLLWVLLILSIVAIIIGAFLPQLQKQRDERDARARLKQSIDEQRAQLARNERKINWLTNDPEYLGIVARDTLGLMKDGETILRVEPAKAAAAASGPPAAAGPARPLGPRR